MLSKNIWIINHYALPPSFGGLNRHYYFAKELIKRGHNVRIFTASSIHNTEINMISADEKNKFKEVVVDDLTYTYVKEPNYKGNGFSRIKNMLGFMFDVPKIKKHFKQEKPDIIYTSSPDLFTAFAAVRLAKKMKIPCVVEIRDLWPLSIVEYKNISNNNPVIQILYQLEKWIYKKADALVFTMPGGKDYITDKKWQKKVSLDKIFNINNGIDLELQDEQFKQFSCDEDLFNDGRFHVSYVGSIREVNNIGTLVDVAQSLQTKDSNIEFIIYGDGTQKKILEQKCLDNNLNNIKFLGRVDKKYVPYICRSSNVNIIHVKQTGVSKYGVSWNKLFDYLAAARPIISTLKVNYDIIKASNSGITCENQDVETIANAILKIKNLPQGEYDAMCERAIHAAAEYDYKKLTDKLEEVINFAINKQ